RADRGAPRSSWPRAGPSRAAHGEAGIARADLAREVGEHPVDRHRAEVVAGAVPQAHSAVFGLAGAHDEHVGDLADLRLADPVAQLLVAVVELGPNARGAQAAVYRARVVDVLLADRQHARLDRREPGREGSGVVLDQHADEALERAEDRPVDHHGTLGLPVAVDVLE